MKIKKLLLIFRKKNIFLIYNIMEIQNEILPKLNEKEAEYFGQLLMKVENINNYRKTYYQNNKDKIKLYQKEYYSNNREEKKKKMLDRYYLKKNKSNN
jgi:hypothetical protein